MTVRPHISEAIVQLRRWVTMCGAAICLCAIAQILTFGVVHYTEARWATVATESERNMSVIAPAVASGTTVAATNGVAPRQAISPVAAKPGRTASGVDGYMRAVSGVSITGGMIGVTSMALLTMLGVAVAAGGAVPGIHLTVRSCVWALILAMTCVPWGNLIASAALPGMFSGYEMMTEASDRVKGNGGEFGLHMQMVGLPLAALVVTPLVCWWFRQGTAAGYVYTHVSEMEEALDLEMAVMRERGAGSLKASASRATGALNLAITPDLSVPLAKAAGAESMSGDVGLAPSLLRPRRINEPDTGEPAKRPI